MAQYDVQRKATEQKNSGNSSARTVQLKHNNVESIIQMAKMNPEMLTQNDVMVLQKTMGNGAVSQLIKGAGDKQKGAIQKKDGKLEENESIQTKKENNTGLPDNLKAGVESLSGLSMDDVRVHYNSDKPTQVGALAYTQGTDIQVAPGQEKHLAHEAWHVVQQAQGRVQATTQMKGVSVNDEIGLEMEADEMGARAAKDIQEPKTHVLLNPAHHNNVATTQLFSAEEADQLINSQYKKWRTWYYEVCMPAMNVIATKSGKTFNDYWAHKDKDAFEQAMKELHTEYKDETSILDRFAKKDLIDSDKYQGMKRVKNTNILVESSIAGNDAKLQEFITLYNSGSMILYRGFSVSHFSYNVLKETGVLGSEGTSDIPTFTMNNHSPTRWIPCMYEVGLPDGIAHTVPQDDAGLREIINRKAVPIGVTVQYTITSPMPVAYINSGEQLIRGPIAGGVTIYRLILLGPNGYSYKLLGGNTSDLPPGAPYKARGGSAEIIEWEANIDAWLQAH
jgi:hypothetical protein